MRMTRRDFIRLCSGSAVGLGLSGMFIPDIVQALEKAASGNPPVVWLQGQSCSGCSVSLLNTVHPSISEVLLKIISMRYHPTVMAAAGDLAISALDDAIEKHSGEFILIVEGAIPTARNGMYATLGRRNGEEESLLNWTKRLGASARGVVAVGACASFGGIPSGKPNPTRAKSVSEVLEKLVVNVPGCPPHPDWMVGTLAHMLLYGFPDLDQHNRPVLFYGNNIHENCQNFSHYNEGNLAQKLSDNGCLIELGCKGPLAHADCYERHWNNGVNWCIGAKAPCIGCCEPDFPDELAPFYAKLPEELLPPRETTTVKNIGTTSEA